MRHFQLFAITLLLFSTVSVGNTQPSDRLYRETGSDISSIMTPGTPFSEYIRNCRMLIETHRVDLSSETRETIIRANTPFELVPPGGDGKKTKYGILLVHGLSNSPYETRALAEYFRSRGFLVRSILLPGHGTVPGDLLSVTCDDFIKACKYGIDSFDGQVDTLFMGGNSLGGTLSFYMGLTDNRIKGLFLFAPAFGVKRTARFANTRVAPVWVSKHGETDYARYESFCSNAAAQTFTLTQKIDRLLSQKKTMGIPVFMAFSQTDMTVNSAKTLSVFTRHLSSKKSRALLYTPTPGIHKDPRITQVDSVVPDQRIIDFSHLSIIVPPEDSHYGKDGDYRLCYFYKNTDSYSACLNSPDIYKGEYTKAYLKLYTLMRLTYNPYFKELTMGIDLFLNNF